MLSARSNVRHTSFAGILAGTVGAVLCLSPALPAVAAAPESDVFHGLTPIADQQLSELRGGFSVKTPLGVMHFDFGVTMKLRAEFPAQAANGNGPAQANGNGGGLGHQIAQQVFELTTNLVFNGKGKIESVETTSTGSLPNNTSVSVTTQGGGGGSTTSHTNGGSAVNTGPQPVNNGTTTVTVDNPNLNGNGGNVSQTVTGSIIMKNWSHIFDSRFRHVVRVGRITRDLDFLKSQ